MSSANNVDSLLLSGTVLGSGNAVVNWTEWGLHFIVCGPQQGRGCSDRKYTKQKHLQKNRGKWVLQKSLKSYDLIGHKHVVT